MKSHTQINYTKLFPFPPEKVLRLGVRGVVSLVKKGGDMQY